MENIYLISALVGWPFILLFIFFGGADADADVDLDLDADLDFDTDVDLDFDTDADFDLDLDADIDADVDADFDASGFSAFGEGIADFVGSLLSFRSAVFGAAFFGTTGFLLGLVDTNALVTLIAAIALGAAAWIGNSMLWRWLKKNMVGSTLTNRQIQGSTGKVVLPIDQAAKGRVALDIGGQPIYYVAKPFHKDHGDQFAVGDEIVVIEVQEGTALVARLDSLAEELGDL